MFGFTRTAATKGTQVADALTPIVIDDAPDALKPDERALVSRTRHALIIGAAVVFWLWGATQVDESQMSDLGLMSVLPWSVFAAIAVMIIGFASVVKIDFSGRLQAAYVIGLTVMLHGIAPFAYSHLRFSWAWRHVGIVDYIQRFGSVDPSIDALPAYHNWPGFFGLNAWITETSQLDSALSYASWAPVLFNLMFLLALYVMYRGFTHDMRLVWTSVLVFTLGNWVGQDYFAPQAVAFFLYLVAMAIMLRWYAHEPGTDNPIPRGSPAAFAVGGVLTITLLAIAVTHQLTPILAISALGALVAFRVVRVSWPLFTLIAFTLAWFLLPARAFVVDNVQTVLRDIGGFQANVDNKLIDSGTVSQTREFVSFVARLLSGAVVGLGGVGWLRRRYLGVRTGWAVLLAAVPAVLVIVSAYGGEVVFRVYLFALPFAAFLAASLWFPKEGTGSRLTTRTSLGVTMLVLAVSLLIADFGADRSQVFTDDEVAAANFVFETAEPGALIVEGTRDYPRSHVNYETFTFLALDRSAPDTLQGLLDDPAGRIAAWLADEERYNGGYVIITESQRNTASILGTLLEPTLDAIELSLLESDLFEVAYESGTARVFAPVGAS